MSKTRESQPDQETREKQPDDFKEKVEIASKMQLPAATDPEYQNLPDELKKQLIGFDDIELEQQLFDIVKTQTKSTITVDKIILAMYHRHKQVVDRTKVQRMLNRMAADGTIVKNTSPRGYALPSAEK